MCTCLGRSACECTLRRAVCLSLETCLDSCAWVYSLCASQAHALLTRATIDAAVDRLATVPDDAVLTQPDNSGHVRTLQLVFDVATDDAVVMASACAKVAALATTHANAGPLLGLVSCVLGALAVHTGDAGVTADGMAFMQRLHRAATSPLQLLQVADTQALAVVSVVSRLVCA